ncbi:WD40 repeat-like protein [Suillus weaverae]|nr:WD40 repeat-like protein [Suillus weaverae]
MSSPTAEMSAVTPCKTMRGHTKCVSGVVHLLDVQRIITCSGDGSLRLWDLESGVQIVDEWRGGGDEAAARMMALPSNGKTLASGGQDGTSTNGERVVSGSFDGTARVWDVKSGEPVEGLNPIKTGHEHVYAVSYSPNTTMIATGGYDEHGIKIWDAKTGELRSHGFQIGLGNSMEQLGNEQGRVVSLVVTGDS